MNRTTQKELKGYAVKSYADLMKIEHTAPKSEKKKPKKIAATSYKKELADFLKHTGTKKFGEVFKREYKETKYAAYEDLVREKLETRRKSRINWGKHCVKLYEADFKKECTLEVNGKYFLKPTTIPESVSGLTELCQKFHKRIEEEHGKPVPFMAGLYKVTIQRFHDMRKEKGAINIF